jgi:16S rRNA (adenine1518-N6/adenine1519-N6)-dimethyltransferase
MPKPLKRFGQNYLVDKNIQNKIVETINPLADDIIIEIGPGTGALTRLLTGKSKKLIAVEIDKRVSDDLKNEFPEVELITGDFLDLNLEKICAENKSKLRVAGNIPYNLTSSIIFKLINSNKFIEDAILMVQYEVAKRMVAKPGSKDYGILTILLNYFTKTELCFRISPNVFFPKPKVYSALVRISFRHINESEELQSTFIKVVKAAFSKRRKTLKNSLGDSIFKDINFHNLDIDFSRRAETLDVNEFLKLTNYIHSLP